MYLWTMYYVTGAL